MDAERLMFRKIRDVSAYRETRSTFFISLQEQRKNSSAKIPKYPLSFLKKEVPISTVEANNERKASEKLELPLTSVTPNLGRRKICKILITSK
jgi:hypothetical protein